MSWTRKRLGLGLMKADALQRALRSGGGASSDFDLNPGTSLAPDRRLRAAAVLVAVQEFSDGPRILLTKRASHLKHHPGQISFPGGKVEATDLSPADAALREAAEEVGLPKDLVEVIGSLPSHETVTGFTVIPVLARIKAPFSPILEVGEVDEMFSVPLDFVTNTANFRVESRLWLGDWRCYYTVPYGPYYIWGATARILRGLAEGLER